MKDLIVQWEQDVTNQGIQIIGTTKIVRRGRVVGTQIMMGQDGSGRQGFGVILAVCRLDDGVFIAIDSALCKAVDIQGMEPLKKSDEIIQAIVK